MVRFLLIAVFVLSSTAVSPAAQTNRKPADGLWREYYDTGVVQREETYKNYVLDGPAKTFYEDGGLASTATYIDGKRQGYGQTFYPNGKVQTEVNFVDDEIDGPLKQYYETGELQRESTYKAGRLQGPSKLYYINGVIQKQMNYVGGTLNGGASEFNEQGQLTAQEEYKDGNRTSRKEFDQALVSSEEKKSDEKK
jgi:antitoxin component YwqK of YwqJK toxin-antitoxin module